MSIRVFAAAAFALSIGLAPSRADSTLRNRQGMPLQPEAVEVHLADDSTLYLALLEDQIDVTTPYGKLRIKLASVLKIDFAIRIPADQAQKIDAAVATLEGGAGKPADAWAALAAAKEFAYPALQRLSHHQDKAIAAKASEMETKLKSSVPATTLARIDRDTVYTETSKIVGHINMTEFKVLTPHFGQLSLKIGDLASMRQGNDDDGEDVPANVLPDPGQLNGYQNKVGQTFYFRVTGAIDDVWGTDIYTTDSSLAAAAVHAGIVRLGQTGVVKVTILAGQQSYAGTTRNGVSSGAYGWHNASFKVARVHAKKTD
jgi:hypothetical protein